jgi:N-acetylglucosamine-6-phosphate deacetylase
MTPSYLNLTNARLIGQAGLYQVCIRQGMVAALIPQVEAVANDYPTIDMLGDWLSLGGIDLQINGALGLAFPEVEPDQQEKLDAIEAFLWEQGIDGYLPTIVTSPVAAIQRSLTVFAQRQPSLLQPCARCLGVHLEGPFLNPEKRGAHPLEFLRPLNLDQVRQVLGNNTSAVKVMTLAPELDETGEVIPYLRSQGITISLGHSLATVAQAQQAFAQGATMVTHAFNAMPTLHHREPGLLGAAILNPQVFCGLIADGRHVSPVMAAILLRASQYDQGIFLVSDALSPLGLPDGTYPWDSRHIEVTEGTARLVDGTLAGTTLGLLVGVQNLVKWGVCDSETAIALATLAPRRAIGLPTDYVGQPAHFLRWHQPSNNALTWERLYI